jgi:hypothetical protein
LLIVRKTGSGDYRPLTGPLRRGDRQGLLGALRPRRVPPKGMHIHHDDLNTLASSPPQADNVVLQGLEKDVLEKKCLVGLSLSNTYSTHYTFHNV